MSQTDPNRICPPLVLQGNLGWAYMQKSNFMAAEILYQKAQMIDPDANKACNMGLCLIKRTRYNGARSVLEDVLYGRIPDSEDGRTRKRAEELLLELESKQPQPDLSDILGLNLDDEFVNGLEEMARYRRKVLQPKVGLQITASSEKNILIMGGTRFIGVFLSRLLVKEGHQVTLFTRGKAPIAQQLPGESDQEFAEFSSKILHLKGDRKDYDFVKSSLSAKGFDVVYDINGREADEVEPILDALPNLEQFIYCSSAGVYLKSDLLPHCEPTLAFSSPVLASKISSFPLPYTLKAEALLYSSMLFSSHVFLMWLTVVLHFCPVTDTVDPKSRHKGKLNTESVLESKGVNWTSLRPVYIYGPLNYNPVEEWFFHRLKAGRPIPIPGSGIQVTQLGHVKDLARAFVQVLGNEKASRQVFNISGEKYVTFDGLARACAKAAGFPEPELVHYNPKEFDFGKKKAFPFRDQHFFASVEKAKHVLGWKPEFDLVEGLADSYNLDFGRGTYRKEADFSTDDMILGKKLVLQA
ncbi:chloroplast stem-loop binding protein of 41 kDa b [Citrus sinensis]|nr:chloroplast stem-loop binding protein of 41 kDa b [Citrus sinensis]